MKPHQTCPNCAGSTTALADPFDPKASLVHGPAGGAGDPPAQEATDKEAVLDRVIEGAVVRAIFGGNDLSRRTFMAAVGASTAMAVISKVFPLEAAKAWAQEKALKPEKTALQIGFVPITCATPLMVAHAMGMYEKYGLTGTAVVKLPSWSVIQENALRNQVDCVHMLSPMPLALTLGIGAQGDPLSENIPFVIPAIENVNGQAITLSKKLAHVKEPKHFKGLTLGVPFAYSMHNLLLRYYLAEGGLDPDSDVHIRPTPPPKMAMYLHSGRIDGFLSPDPFNQLAVHMGAGFIFKLSRDIWPGHPCCAFACRQDFATRLPNSFKAVLHAVVEAALYCRKMENRREIAGLVAPYEYLDKPREVVEQVLTGEFPDGLGNTIKAPDRIDFNPFPWQSAAVWILTQMKRWGYIKGDVNYRQVAEQVFLAGECREAMKSFGVEAPAVNYDKPVIMGKECDPEKPVDYLESFAIKRK